MGYVIGCDIGSQSLKAVLLAEDGSQVNEAAADYPIDYPHPTWAEQSAERWLLALRQAVPAVLAASGVDPTDVSAIGLAAQVDGVVAVDAVGRPLHPAMIWMDRRAVAACESAAGRLDPQRMFKLSGLNLDASHVAPKIAWLRTERPDVYHQARRLLLPGSYVAFALTGEYGVDYSNASSTLLMDVRRKAWSTELCQAFEIDPELLAPIFPATHILGNLTSEAAAALGLTTGCVVVLGSGDEHAACLGAGVIQPGDVCDIAGTAEPVCAASSEPVFDAAGLVETHAHAHPERWLIENPGFVSGANYRWFRDQFTTEPTAESTLRRESPYDRLNELAAGVQPGSEGLILLPCLMGAMTPTWNAEARGVYFGFTLAHTQAHFVRALLEASAYAVRDIVDRMRQIGLPLRRIQTVGGGARSRLLRQIKADVTGLPVVLPHTTETTSLGAGMLALVGAGIYPSLEEITARCVRIVETCDPDPARHAVYEQYYRLYQAAYTALLPVFSQAARIGQTS